MSLQKKDNNASVAFNKHLERASQIVSTWPEWKQSVLGSIQVKPASSSPQINKTAVAATKKE